MLAATSIARHSRVYSSITVRHFSVCPFAQASNTKSYAHTWFAPLAGHGRAAATRRGAAVAAPGAGLDARSGARVCQQALEVFVSIYGAEAGNLALKMLASGGVYVGGGIAAKLVTKFRDKGRMRALLERIPVKVVINENAALLGAAALALGMCEGATRSSRGSG